MPSLSDVVITGVGIVSPIGIGVPAFRSALRELRSGVSPITLFDASNLPVQIGGQVLDFDAKQYVTPRKSLKVMSRDIQFAFAAADMACNEAGLPAEAAEPERMGVVFAGDMMYGELTEFPAGYRDCIVDGRFEFDRWGRHALPQFFPLLMLKYLPNMAACHVAIARNARGPNNSIVLGEVSSLQAIAEAMRVIERGHADIMIAGGSSSRMHPMRLLVRGPYESSQRNADPAAASRPFDADRDGMVHGEGAAAFVLESRVHAERRGAAILGRVAGFASRQQTRPGAAAAEQTIKQSIAGALQNAGWQASDVGHVNADGLSTIEQDRIEARAIRELLGDVPVTAPKSFFGNLGSSTGAVELAASVIDLQAGEAPPTLNYERPDPQCPVRVVRGEPLRTSRRTVLALNQSFVVAALGQAAALAITAED